ncbi:MAG: VpsF family polysaccharide biosynthesis protein [Alphaproteobacteria bacterium]
MFSLSHLDQKVRAPGAEGHFFAGLVCLFGFFLHIVLSDLLLNSVGFRYSSTEGAFYEKIHPGTYFIVASFFVMLGDSGNPFREFWRTLHRSRIALFLLLLYVMLFVYLIFRSGPAGTAFMIDTHMTAPICAIVLATAPKDFCRRAIYFFVFVAVVNSIIGIGESITQTRIFEFGENAPGIREEYFRASSLRGHPLNNAMFTSIALFVMLGLRFKPLLTWGLATLFMVSLVAFGGRAGLAFSIFGVMLYAAVKVKEMVRHGRMSMLQVLFLVAAIILVPVIIVAGLNFLILHSSIGERLAASSITDDSADSRRLALMVFDYMRTHEIILGVAPERIVDIAYRMNLIIPLSDIENPWLLMFMYLGGLMFPFWLLMTGVFVWDLMRSKPMGLKLAVLSYFLVASTSNSFGRKDSTYLIMVCAVICAARALDTLANGAVAKQSPVQGKLPHAR